MEKFIVSELMERRVVELCGATAKAHGWGNADIIPGIRIPPMEGSTEAEQFQANSSAKSTDAAAPPTRRRVGSHAA
jgi:hypothetical protein